MPELTPAQERAALLIAEGMNDSEAARKVHKTPQTIWRWHKNIPEFNERIAQLRTNATAEAMEILRISVTDAVEVIVDIAKNGAVSEEEGSRRLQFNAAKWVAERVLRPIEKGAEIEGDGSKRAREVIGEIEHYTGDDVTDLLERGTG